MSRVVILAERTSVMGYRMDWGSSTAKADSVLAGSQSPNPVATVALKHKAIFHAEIPGSAHQSWPPAVIKARLPRWSAQTTQKKCKQRPLRYGRTR